MGERVFTIRLPPEGTLLRDLTMTSLSYIHEHGREDLKLSFEGDVVRIRTWSTQVFSDSFKGLYEEAANIASVKSEKIRLGLLLNDRGVLSKLLKKELKGFTYLDAIRDFLQARARKDPDFLSLSTIEVRGDEIRLGRGGFVPAINPLVSERYEHGLEFWKLNYARKLRIVLDEEWYAMVLAGFALAIASLVNGDLLMVYLPEDFMMRGVPDKLFEVLKALGGLRGFYGLQKKVNGVIYRRQCPAEPYSAFLLFTSLNLVKEAQDISALYVHNHSLPLALCKLRRSGNVFTMMERKRAELFDALRFAARLMREGEGLVEELLEVVERALSLRMGAELTTYHRFCNLLLQSIQGAYSPYEVAYYGARSDLIHDHKLVRGIINALS